MGVVPNTSIPGQVYTSTGFQNGGVWAGGNSGSFQITKSYTVLGPLIAYTLPGFSMSVPTGQTVNLVAVIAKLSAGTVTADALQNGSGITGLTAVSVTTSSTGYVNPTTNPTPVADLDFFAVTLSSPSSTGDLSFDFVFEIMP